MIKVLIIRFSSIGDIVLTTPVIRCVKQQAHGGEVNLHYLTKKQFVPLLKANPYIDELKTIENRVSEITDELQSENYDYILDLHRNLRTAQVKRALNIPHFSFDKLNLHKWIYVNFKVNVMPDEHIVDRYMATAETLGVKNDLKGLDYFIPEKDEVNINSFPVDFQGGYIAFAIGGQHRGKMLPAHKIIDICRALERPIILLGGKEDRENSKFIAESVGDNVLNTCGKYNINQSASMLKQSDAVITHDTGLMHIASAFKKKVISIWGATVPEFGMYPYLPGEGSRIIRPKGITKPYSKLGNRQWFKLPFKGMEKIDVAEVVEAVG